MIKQCVALDPLSFIAQRLGSFAQDVQIARIGKQPVSSFARHFFRDLEFREASRAPVTVGMDSLSA